MSKLIAAGVVTVVGNRDTGSLPVPATSLPKEFQENGMKPAPGTLALREVGSTEIKNVTYIMGSQAKGYHLCAKGAGKFPTDGKFEILVQEDLAGVTLGSTEEQQAE